MSVARHASVVGGSTALRRTAFLLLSGLFLGTPLCQPANAQEMPAERPPRVDSYAAFVAEAAQRFGIPEAWIQIGRAHVCTPVTNAHLVCRLLLETKKYHTQTLLSTRITTHIYIDRH